MNEDIKKAQEASRFAMRKLHEVCHKFGITYYYDSGSLIGAIRHKSFIPWDDDIDIAVTRENYEKLLKVPKEEWGDEIRLVTGEELTPGGFLDNVTRLFNLRDEIPVSTFDKCLQKCIPECKNRMCVDIFILDNAYDSDLRQNMLVKRLMLLYGMAMGHRDDLDLSEYKGMSKAVVAIMAAIGKFVSLDWIRKRYLHLSLKPTYSNSHRYFYSNYPTNYMGFNLDKRWYSDTISVSVDEDYFDAPVGYDNILRMLYGDYMKLPPVEARIPTHIR